MPAKLARKTEARELDQLCINTIRTLAMDAVQHAKSGHRGTPMALAPLVYTIWQNFLRFDPEDPIWPMAAWSRPPILIDNEFVLRYQSHDTVDGLPAGEGAFLVCSFWLVDNYILQGRYEEARRLFDRLLSRCNDVGLLSEEFGLQTGRMLGNFPQAYSHVGLINCALNLSRQVGPTKERAEVNRREATIETFS
jgi:hypothetical protein